MIGLFFVGMAFVGRQLGKETAERQQISLVEETESAAEELQEENAKAFRICIDPGHGGFDPGKVGPGEVYEKDINLAIALELKELLQEQGCQVYLTRQEDTALCPESVSNHKAEDMRLRAELAEQLSPQLLVSIHQNSFPQASVRGAQVFYYRNSHEGRLLAQLLQEALWSSLGTEYKRNIQENDTYYLLKHVTMPAAIVECGFLSNPEECALLQEPEYQHKLAWGIATGILEYLKNQEKSGIIKDEL